MIVEPFWKRWFWLDYLGARIAAQFPRLVSSDAKLGGKV